MYGEGISRVGEIIDIGVTNNIIDKAGAWFSYNDLRIGQGKENVKKYLKENPAIADEIIIKIKNLSNLTISADENAQHNVENTSDV